MKKKRIENFVMSLNDELGEGSFGKVFKGINEDTKQVVAIKVLSKKMIDQDEYVKDALVSEIKIMRKLKSEYIVGFVDILETANNYYVVQEYCNGGDLRVALKKTKTFTQAQAIDYLQQILMGFLELIENSVIHRDMKPENIMVHNGRLKIADFGFAKNVISRNQMQKSMVGTPLYMAPQVLKREKYTSKCDIWAIGVIFFEMLFGSLPWSGKSEYELVTNIMKKQFTIPPNSTVAPNSIDFIRGCLKEQQSKRFSWHEVYEHPLFAGHFTAFTEKNKKLSEKAGYVINKLRLEIHSQNIDMEKLFNRLKYSKATSLTKEEFFNLLKTLDNKIDDAESQYVFEKFDSDCNGLIELEEFKQILVQNGVRMSGKPLLLQKKQTIIDEEGDQDEYRVTQIVVKLRQKIQAHKLDLFTVYDSYDKNKDQSLSFEEFTKLLCKIDNSLTPAEQAICFNKFDINGDKKISFQEFYRTICKIAGEPVCLAARKRKSC